MSDNNKTEAEDTADLSLGRSSLIGVVGKAILAFVGFAGIVFFYRSLGPSRFGIYYTVLAAGKLTTSIQSGITSAIKKRISEVDAEHSEFLGLGLFTLGAVTLIGVCAVIAVKFSAPMVLNIAGQFGVATEADRLVGSTQYLFAALVISLSLGLFGLSNQFYAGVGNPGKAIWIDAARSVATIGAQAALITVGFGEFGLIWGFVGGTVITGIAVLFSLRLRPTFPSYDAIIRTVSFAKWSIPQGFVAQLYNRFDVLLLTLFIGAASSGVYAPAMQLTVPAAFVGSSIGSSLNIKSSGLSSINESVAEDVRNAFAYAGVIAIPIFFGALALPERLLSIIFGPSASAGATALIGLAGFQLFRSYHYPLGSVIGGLDRPDLGFKILVVTLLTNVPLALVLIQSYGLLGVVAATVTAEGVRTVLSYAVVTRLTESLGLPHDVFEQIFAGVVMLAVLEGLNLIGIVPTNQVTLGLIVGLGAGIYFVVLTVVSRRFQSTAVAILHETIPEKYDKMI